MIRISACIWIFLTVLTFGLSGLAHADTAPNPVCNRLDVSGSIGCKDGINKGNHIEISLNNTDDPFFRFDDWTLLQKQDAPWSSRILEIGSKDIGIVVGQDSGTKERTWEFDQSAWDEYDNLLIVLKGGVIKEKEGDAKWWWFAYLLDNNQEPASGTWDYPENKDLSHLSVYGAGTPAPVPSTLLLFGTSLVGLIGLRRKLKR